MTEQEALRWLAATFDVPRETMSRLDGFVDLLRLSAGKQNLISASTVETVWSRHIADSAQLLLLAPGTGPWLDIGSGAGFPGLMIAALGRRAVTLIEPRKKRVEFLVEAARTLAISEKVTIVQSRAETAPIRPFDVISARACAPLERLFAIGSKFANAGTRWLLPKGRSALAELEAARGSWQGVFRIEPSVTDPGSSIVVAEQVKPREQL